MPSSFGFHRMSPPCARGATASGGVTFKRAASFLIPSTCYLLHRLLAFRLSKLPRLVRHRRSNACKREGAVRRARPGSSRVLKSLVEIVVSRIVTCVRGLARSGLLGVLALPVPSTVGCQRHRHEDGTSYFTSVLVAPAPRLLDECRRPLPLILGL